MKNDIFSFSSYKDYLNSWVGNQPNRGRGAKSRLAKAAGCQPAYVSQILSGGLNFSLEQAQAINLLLGHSKEGAHYFLLLIQKARAGTKSLESYFQEQIDSVLKKRFLLKDRLGVAPLLNTEDQQRYYSSWIYAAIHVITDIPEYRTTQAIAERLGLSPQKVSDVIDFLQKMGLVEADESGLRMSKKSIHLGSDSPLIARHHTNWRLRTIASFDNEDDEAIHYSSTITLSRKHWMEVKERLVDTIQQVKATVRQTEEEAIFCFSLDLFEL